jgi:hypothetical protein
MGSRDSPASAVAVAAAPPHSYDRRGERHSGNLEGGWVLSGSWNSRRRVAGVVGLAALATAIAGMAWAQNPPDDKPALPAPGVVRSSPLPAPVGHRQPRASDIPPPPAGDNSQAVEPRDNIDEKLRICRGC